MCRMWVRPKPASDERSLGVAGAVLAAVSFALQPLCPSWDDRTVITDTVSC